MERIRCDRLNVKFSIALADLETLLRGAGVSRPKKTDTLKLSACAARVFVETKDGVAGIEALVLADGSVTLPSKSFAAVLKTYKGTKFLNLDGSAAGLQINSFRMPVLSYDPAPTPPANFQVFPAAAGGDEVCDARQALIVKRAIEVLNELEGDGVFSRYAIGGAMGAIFYTEPFLTFDLDVFVVLPAQGGGLLSLSGIYNELRARGYKEEQECVVIEGVPVQFPDYNALIEEPSSRRGKQIMWACQHAFFERSIWLRFVCRLGGQRIALA